MILEAEVRGSGRPAQAWRGEEAGEGGREGARKDMNMMMIILNKGKRAGGELQGGMRDELGESKRHARSKRQ